MASRLARCCFATCEEWDDVHVAPLARYTFGGVGIYLDRVVFALIANDVLYFKVDDSNRGDYEAAGMTPFKPYPTRNTTMPYYEVPVSVLEDIDQLTVWGRKACAIRSRLGK